MFYPSLCHKCLTHCKGSINVGWINLTSLGSVSSYVKWEYLLSLPHTNLMTTNEILDIKVFWRKSKKYHISAGIIFTCSCSLISSYYKTRIETYNANCPLFSLKMFWFLTSDLFELFQCERQEKPLCFNKADYKVSFCKLILETGEENDKIIDIFPLGENPIDN